MNMARQSATKRRLILACCMGDPASPMTQAQKHRGLSQLRDLQWAPTPNDTPAPFEMIQDWYADLQRKGPKLIPRRAKERKKKTTNDAWEDRYV